MAGHYDLSDFKLGILGDARRTSDETLHLQVAMQLKFSRMTVLPEYREYGISGKTSNLGQQCGQKKILKEQGSPQLTKIL